MSIWHCTALHWAGLGWADRMGGIAVAYMLGGWWYTGRRRISRCAVSSNRRAVPSRSAKMPHRATLRWFRAVVYMMLPARVIAWQQGPGQECGALDCVAALPWLLRGCAVRSAGQATAAM